MEKKVMRRKDREVTEFQQIVDILSRCDSIRIGINGNEYPYVIPVSFGMEIAEGKVVVYFHSAIKGMKIDLLNANNKICVEGDIFIRTEDTAHGITTRYESVMGFGRCVFLNDITDIIHGLKLICEHYGYSDYQVESCGSLTHVMVGKITLDKIFGKRNLPQK